MKFGLFIELPNTVEGLVHISRMNDDYYQYVEQFMALVGRNTRRTYKMGQAIRVKVVNVDVKQSAVDFDIVDPEKTPQSNMLPKRTYHNNNYHGNNERHGNSNNNSHSNHSNNNNRGRNNNTHGNNGHRSHNKH